MMTVPKTLIVASVLSLLAQQPQKGSCSYPRDSDEAAVCRSPDGRSEVLARPETLSDGTNGGVLLLSQPGAQSPQLLYRYERGVSIVWSPDSKRLIVNEFAGSDFTRNFVFSVESVQRIINIGEALTQKLPGRSKARIIKNDHVYVVGRRWINRDTVEVIVYGHGENDPHGFCAAYALGLDETVRVAGSFSVPRGSDPEQYCDAISQ